MNSIQTWDRSIRVEIVGPSDPLVVSSSRQSNKKRGAFQPGALSQVHLDDATFSLRRNVNPERDASLSSTKAVGLLQTVRRCDYVIASLLSSSFNSYRDLFLHA